MSSDEESLQERNAIEKEPVSDVEGDNFGPEDYYGSNNKVYQSASYLPTINAPEEDQFGGKKRRNDNFSKSQSITTYKKIVEDLISIINPYIQSNYDNDIDIDPSTVIDNYQIKYSNNFDYSLEKYDAFSKNPRRTKLRDKLNEVNWKNEQKVIEAKKITNAYEDIYEKFFDKRCGYRLANINSLFKKELFTVDRVMGYTPIFIVGDTGGYADYIQWFSHKSGFKTKIFLIPEKTNSIQLTKFRREIAADCKETMQILNEFYDKCDLDENPNLSVEFLNKIAEKINKETETYGVNFYIAKKVIKYVPNQSQEMLYRNFLLANIILCFDTLNTGGNFVIKIYDSFSLFTVSLIFILFKSFEKITIVKPFSSRPYSASKYIVCEKFIEMKPKILNYLKNFYDKYLELVKRGLDVQFVLPISEVTKSESFTNPLFEINQQITERRIDVLDQMIKYMTGGQIYRFDKMYLKKNCLDSWGIPVINYDEKQILSNKLSSEASHNRVKTLDEIAKDYQDYGKYSEETNAMVAMLINDKEKKEVKVHKPAKKKELTQKEIEDGLNAIFGRKKGSKKSNTKKENEKEKGKETKKTHRKIDRDKEEIDKDKEEIDKYMEKKRRRGPKNNIEDMPHRESHKKQEKSLNETVMEQIRINREKMENEKQVVSKEKLQELLKYKKKKI